MSDRKQYQKFSTRLIRKGALLEETHRVFLDWDLGGSFEDNIARARELNLPAANNQGWLKEVITTISSRWHDEPMLPAIVTLAQRASFDVWRACVLWHIGRRDELYYHFATEWLFQEYQDGAFRIRTAALEPFVDHLTRERRGEPLSSYGTTRAARDLLRMASDFGLMTGTSVREFATYHIPEESFLYLLHALFEVNGNGRDLLQSPDWRLYLMSPADVEREIYRLHQFRKLRFEIAGSLAEITLPHGSAQKYAEEMHR